MAGTIEQERVSALKPDPGQPRRTFDSGQLKRLGASLLKKQWYPLLIRPNRVIVDGECRWRAAAIVGIETLDVIVIDEHTTREQGTEIQLVTALHRAALTPHEQAIGFRDWLAYNTGATAKELAVRIDRDPSIITKYVSIFDCIPAVQEAAAAAKIGPSQWYPISLLPAADQQELLGMHLAGVPRDQIAQASRKQRRQGGASDRLSRIPCRLPGGVSVVISGKDMSLDAAIEALTDVLKAAKKAREDGLTAKSWTAAMKDKAQKKEVSRE